MEEVNTNCRQKLFKVKNVDKNTFLAIDLLISALVENKVSYVWEYISYVYSILQNNWYLLPLQIIIVVKGCRAVAFSLIFFQKDKKKNHGWNKI